MRGRYLGVLPPFSLQVGSAVRVAEDMERERERACYCPLLRLLIKIMGLVALKLMDSDS